jgi:hypothetical protein
MGRGEGRVAGDGGVGRHRRGVFEGARGASGGAGVGRGGREGLLAALAATPGRVRTAALAAVAPAGADAVAAVASPTDPAAVATALTDADGEGRTPDPEWSVSQVVRHLIAVERDVFHARLAQLAAGGIEPTWAWVEPGPDERSEGRSLEELASMFSTLRESTLRTLATMDEAGWARAGVHATLGRLDVSGLMRILREHDDDHIADLESRATR